MPGVDRQHALDHVVATRSKPSFDDPPAGWTAGRQVLVVRRVSGNDESDSRVAEDGADRGVVVDGVAMNMNTPTRPR